MRHASKDMSFWPAPIFALRSKAWASKDFVPASVCFFAQRRVSRFAASRASLSGLWKVEK